MAETHPDWALGFQDETWWSRTAQPQLHAFCEPDAPLKLEEKVVPKTDPDPKALACYGVLWRTSGDDPDEVWLRFVDGQPVSGITTQFLAYCCDRLAERGKRAWLLVWDNASWHLSREVKRWIATHNRTVKHKQPGVRIISCHLPTKSPWLNPIEPHWIHGKRRVLEPARLLSAAEVERRVCATFSCSVEAHLAVPEKAT